MGEIRKCRDYGRLYIEEERGEIQDFGKISVIILRFTDPFSTRMFGSITEIGSSRGLL